MFGRRFPITKLGYKTFGFGFGRRKMAKKVPSVDLCLELSSSFPSLPTTASSVLNLWTLGSFGTALLALLKDSTEKEVEVAAGTVDAILKKADCASLSASCYIRPGSKTFRGNYSDVRKLVSSYYINTIEIGLF